MTKPAPTEAERFAVIGHALYGPSQRGWQKPLATALGCNVRTVQHYAANTRDIPPAVWPKLATLLTAHAAKLRKLALGLQP